MTWQKETLSSQVPFFDSLSTDVETLTVDIEIVLKLLNERKLIDGEGILLDFDVGNMYVFISGYLHKKQQIFSNKGVCLELPALLEKHIYDDFNIVHVIVLDAFRKAFDTTIGKLIKQQFKIFYRTEFYDAREFK